MKVMSAFFRRKYQWFLKNTEKNGTVFFLILLFCLAGCGEENIEQPHYNPVSPLPLRIDAKPTPTVSATPPLEQHLKDQEETSDEETEQNTPIPLSDVTPSLETPTPTAKDDTEEGRTSTELPHTPTPQLKEESTPSPVLKKTKAAPTLTPTPTPKPTETPKIVPKIQKKVKKAEESKDLSSRKKTNAEQSLEKQGTSKQKTEKFTPIVTPYDITIDKLAVCSKISNRNPVNCGDTFSLSKTRKVFTWMRVSGVKPPKVAKHVYYREGKIVTTVKLKLKYTSMRTWSQKTLFSKQGALIGKWKVVITTEEDEIIAIKEFTVAP